MRTKMNLEEVLEEHSNDQFCMLCIKPRGSKDECCGEQYFLKLKDFDNDTQTEIVQSIINGKDNVSKSAGH